MNIEKEINAIKNRNKKVETDKAWETSLFRTITISLMTYFVILLFMAAIGVNNSLVNALVPTIGFFLSTQSLPFIKKWWLKRKLKN